MLYCFKQKVIKINHRYKNFIDEKIKSYALMKKIELWNLMKKRIIQSINEISQPTQSI